jgi:putative FmdB family regulatory protein
MPTYDYHCPKCGHRFELFHGIKDDEPKRCPKCRAVSRRIPSGGAGVLFKGSGFYITDYRSKSYREKARQEKSASSGSGSSGGKPSSAGGGDSPGRKPPGGGGSGSPGGKPPAGG